MVLVYAYSEMGFVDIAEHPGGPWIAKLPQGEIELVAISRHPSKDQPWWVPDGSPYVGKAPEGTTEKQIPSRRGYDFVEPIKVSGADKGVRNLC